MHLGYIELEKSALVWCEILRLFVNMLTDDNKYSPCNVHNFAPQVKRHYLKNKKLFQDFLLHFWNVHEIQNISKKKMNILA